MPRISLRSAVEVGRIGYEAVLLLVHDVAEAADRRVTRWANDTEEPLS